MSVPVVIADDEVIARRRMARLLRERDDVSIVAECSGGVEAVERIKEMSPGLVLLDVQMPDLDGFGVLRALEGGSLPGIVFVTAYDRYAIQAFEVAAIDYVLKPYETHRFHEAVDRALAHVAKHEDSAAEERLKRLLREVLREHNGSAAAAETTADASGFQRIMVKQQGRSHFVRAEDVDWIESDGNYLRLHVGPRSHLVRGTITSWAERLDQKRFVRIHRRFIVNMNRIQEIQPWFAGDCVVMLVDGTKLRLSRTFRGGFEARMVGG